jgi:hypothetical protein
MSASVIAATRTTSEIRGSNRSCGAYGRIDVNDPNRTPRCFRFDRYNLYKMPCNSHTPRRHSAPSNQEYLQ